MGNKNNNQELIDFLNSHENLSIRDLLVVLVNIRISVIITIASIMTGCSLAIYDFSAKRQINSLGLPLKQPFHMAIKSLNLENMQSNETDGKSIPNIENQIVLKDVYLVEDDNKTGLSKDEIRLYIQKTIDPGLFKDSKIIGKILARKVDKVTKPWHFSKLSFEEPAYAQERFRWYGREKNRNFYEKRINLKTIRRYYHDCWILEYKIDRSGRSIQSSFNWIRKGHSFFGHCF